MRYLLSVTNYSGQVWYEAPNGKNYEEATEESYWTSFEDCEARKKELLKGFVSTTKVAIGVFK